MQGRGGDLGGREMQACRVGLISMWQELAQALCLVLVLEGMAPLVAPARWRAAMAQMAALDLRTLRAIGLASMLLGAGLLFLVS